MKNNYETSGPNIEIQLKPKSATERAQEMKAVLEHLGTQETAGLPSGSRDREIFAKLEELEQDPQHAFTKHDFTVFAFGENEESNAATDNFVPSFSLRTLHNQIRKSHRPPFPLDTPPQNNEDLPLPTDQKDR